MNYPAASSGVSIREKSKALRRKRRGIQPKEIKEPCPWISDNLRVGIADKIMHLRHILRHYFLPQQMPVAARGCRKIRRAVTAASGSDGPFLQEW
jgi:hypothetical protein